MLYTLQMGSQFPMNLELKCLTSF